MCGIVGKYCYNSDQKVSEELIRDMTQMLIHRGPDDEGVWCQGNVGLGHRRLSIIDLSSAGHQPMMNRDRSIVLVFNGEIYNYKELRRDLIEKGYQFVSQTDTEVLIYLYQEYKEGCLKYLTGMFAFALWDDKNKSLFIARDRFGKKPLKYYTDGRSIIFASELKAILKDPQVVQDVDYNSINHYLSYHYLPSPFTGFKNIHKLPHAHYMMVKGNKITIKRYWNLDYSIKTRLSEADIKDEIIRRLKEAVKIRMISDVPLGAFLSGGIDSSAIVAMMSRLSNMPVKTFSIGFEEGDYNELNFARMMAEKYHTDHHEFIVKADAISILPKLIWHYEEPYGDSSALPTYYLSQLTREHVTVALNGDGGDENFAGYTRYKWMKMAHYFIKLPKSLRKLFLFSLVQGNKLVQNQTIQRFISLSQTLTSDVLENYYNTILYMDETQKDKCYTPQFKSLVRAGDSYSTFQNFLTDHDLPDEMDKVLSIDFNSYVPDDLMVKVDIASMAHSLESRSPLLDHNFVEFIASVDSKIKLRRFQSKSVFKSSLSKWVPHEILYRKKMGFGIPIDQWLRGNLNKYMKEILLREDSFLSSIIQKTFIHRLIEEHSNGSQNHSYKLWALLVLELWHECYFKRA